MNLVELSPRARAERAQQAASDPAVSAFVSASAGSGKTKLLTDRLLRLMLAGADPARIQCLTFTKAGAAEMSLRLYRRLGDWVTASDDTLDADLGGLAIAPDAGMRCAARELFARVLDLPGGMRIGTIHAFCQSLLRRFPLEAALSPYFRLLEGPDADAVQRAAREAAIAGADPAGHAALDSVASEISLAEFARLVQALQSRPERLATRDPAAMAAAQRRLLGVGEETEEDVLRGAIAAMDLPGFRVALQKVAGDINGNLKTKVPAALLWLAHAPPVEVTDWHHWARYFLTGEGKPCNHKWLVSAATEQAHPGIRALLLDEQERVCAALDRLRPIRIARLSADLMRLALPAIDQYDARKQQAGQLDYGDLIGRANELLREPGAAWVLYKLDGGLDHLLLDEVQDTAPDQWRIADALTAEFFAGEGAQRGAQGAGMARTIFAVGDRKQSIFSFQGAAPDSFDFWRDEMCRRTRAAQGRWQDVPLDVSFRSTTPVLELVDAVFNRSTALMNATAAEAMRHIADRADHAGRVELWPLVPLPVTPEPEPWAAVQAGGRAAAGGPEQLAQALAEWIAQALAAGTRLESRGRALHAGDIMVLVRARGSFDRALLHALKSRGVPVAGLDRMVLTEQPAVADLLALCDTLLLPRDDLALANVLTSPLGDLTDDSLMELALGRRRGLWEVLRARAAERPDWQAAYAMLAALFARVDYVSPHALLSEVLGPLGGRARLFARLGPQAAEPIDELLTMALDYAATHPASLQGFVHWLRQSGSEVKRQVEDAAREVRIMTVHSAKGLQAPMVILPATAGLSRRDNALVWVPDPDPGAPAGAQVPLWGPRRETHDALMQRHLEQAVDLEREEHYRLLYVALTRAEDRLLVCGWEPKRAKPECWYDKVREAFGQLPESRSETFAGPWEGELLSYATPQRAKAVIEKQVQVAEDVPMPGWVGEAAGWRPSPPPVEPRLPGSLAPSRPQDAALGDVPQAASPLALRDAGGKRFRRGRLLHGLLQHLPNLPPDARAEAARVWLGRAGTGITPRDAADLAGDLAALLEDPSLAPLFGPGSRAEVPLTGVIRTASGEAVVGGLVDRLAELPDRILVADYKTNRDPPDTVAETPVLYLRQMAAYRLLLRRIFPDRPVFCILIWTRTGRADWLDDTVLATHAPDAAHMS